MPRREIVKKHHRKTAIDFKRWVAKNPNASLKRRTEAFNAIADTNFYDRTQVKTDETKAKVK